jgi:phospholipase C
MPQKSKKARATEKATKGKAVTKAPRSTKKVSARAAKASRSVAAKPARARSKKLSVARAGWVQFVPGGNNDNLGKIDHIVVLMMENRSFDHMLGYLKLEGANPDVNGLEAGMSNTHEHNSYPVHHLPKTVFEHDPAAA